MRGARTAPAVAGGSVTTSLCPQEWPHLAIFEGCFLAVTYNGVPCPPRSSVSLLERGGLLTQSVSQFCPRASHPVPHRLALQRRGAPAVSVRYAMRYMRVRGLDLAGLPHVFAPSMRGGPSRGTACIQRRAANAGRLTAFMRSCRRASPGPHYSLAHSPAPCRSSSAGRRRRRRDPGSTRGRPTVARNRSTVRESSS